MTAGSQSIEQAGGEITLDARTVGFNLDLVEGEGRNANVKGRAVLHADGRAADVQALTVALGSAPWTLVPARRGHDQVDRCWIRRFAG